MGIAVIGTSGTGAARYRRCVLAVTAAIPLLLVTVGALGFRLQRLDLRPMHGDEANQARKAGTLLETGVYHYDPREHHGPTLYYAVLPIAWLTGVKNFADSAESTYRIVPVLFSAGLLLLLLLCGDALGRPAALFAGILTAISPGLTFYSRYFIQEMPLVFFTFALLVFLWRYYKSPRLGWALLAGVSAGLMHATKETCVIAFASILGALVLTAWWTRNKEHPPSPPSKGDSEHGSLEGALPGTPSKELQCPKTSTLSPVEDSDETSIESPFEGGGGGCLSPQTLSIRCKTDHHVWHLIAFVAAAVLVSVVLFSSFFTYARGPLDSLLTYATYWTRADGAGSSALHDKPWYYYLRILVYARMSSGTWWSEGLIVGLAAIWGAAALCSRPKSTPHARVACFLTFYTILMTAICSAIPYKTPWCLLSLLHAMTLLGGLGVAALFRWTRSMPLKIAVGAVLAAAALHLAGQAYRANVTLCADPRNPYVYAHPAPAIRHITERAEELANVHPSGHDMLIRVIKSNGDYWPLPWYLRHFTHVGYWSAIPDSPDAPVIITSPDMAPDLDAKLRDTYEHEFYSLRPRVMLQMYINADLWENFMKTRQ